MRRLGNALPSGARPATKASVIGPREPGQQSAAIHEEAGTDMADQERQLTGRAASIAKRRAIANGGKTGRPDPESVANTGPNRRNAQRVPSGEAAPMTLRERPSAAEPTPARCESQPKPERDRRSVNQAEGRRRSIARRDAHPRTSRRWASGTGGSARSARIGRARGCDRPASCHRWFGAGCTPEYAIRRDRGSSGQCVAARHRAARNAQSAQ